MTDAKPTAEARALHMRLRLTAYDMNDERWMEVATAEIRAAQAEVWEEAAAFVDSELQPLPSDRDFDALSNVIGYMRQRAAALREGK